MAQHPLELALILQRNDDQDVADTSDQQDLQRKAVDHRFGVYRQQLIRHALGDT